MRRKGLVPTVVFLVAGVLLAAPAAIAMTLDLRQGDSGRPIHVRGGDVVTITLAENQSTPYRWRFARRPSRRILRLVKSEYVAAPAPPGLVGRGGKHVFTFRVARGGSTALQLQLSYISDARQVSRRFALRIRPS